MPLDSFSNLHNRATICFASPGLYQLYAYEVKMSHGGTHLLPSGCHVQQGPIYFLAEH